MHKFLQAYCALAERLILHSFTCSIGKQILSLAMADNELDHMMASIHRDASLSNQHAAQTSDFGDVYPAAAGMPNTSWMNQNAFFGSSNTILNTTAPISMTGLDQSGIPKQYHQTHAAYGNFPIILSCWSYVLTVESKQQPNRLLWNTFVSRR